MILCLVSILYQLMLHPLSLFDILHHHYLYNIASLLMPLPVSSPSIKKVSMPRTEIEKVPSTKPLLVFSRCLKVHPSILQVATSCSCIPNCRLQYLSINFFHFMLISIFPSLCERVNVLLLLISFLSFFPMISSPTAFTSLLFLCFQSLYSGHFKRLC